MSDHEVQPGTDGASTENFRPPKTSRFKRWMIFVLAAGVFLPFASVVVELGLRACSSIFFDPLPTGWHVLLWCLVPFVNLLAVIAVLRARSTSAGLLIFGVGLATGVSFIYSLQFLPVSPFAALGILCLGIGLCGLSPFFALITTLICNARLRDLQLISRPRHTRLLWSGILTGIIALVVLVVPSYITDSGLRMAASPDEAVSTKGVKLIRMLGSESALLRACYGLPTSSWVNPFGATGAAWNSNTRQQARDAYYRVTGNSFNSVEPPRLFGPRSDVSRDFEFDSDVGGTAVDGKVFDLSVASSRIDSVIRPDELVGYTEWTLTFRNTSTLRREARTEIALPPGGVVSRLTLWVNGEEREAAFSTRGKVREAYQQVAVVQQRDPVLVTTCGPDRVLMQCFPVPAGGTMKVRLGITSPLTLDRTSKSTLILPHFVEKNFSVSSGTKHSLYIESSEPISFDKAKIGSSKVIRELVADDELAGRKGGIICNRNPSILRTWTSDTTDPSNYAVLQTISTSTATAPDSVVLVFDSSKRLKDAREQVAKALQLLPRKCKYSVIAAGDETEVLSPMQEASPAAIESAGKRLRDIRCIGGIDNRPALIEACDLVEQDKNSVVLWVHGPQPLQSENYKEQLLQRWDRHPGSFRIISVCASDGRNSILAELESIGAVQVVPRRADLATDLQNLFLSWRGPTPAVTRERVAIGAVGNAVKASSHVCRLWAKDEVMRMCSTGGSRIIPKASAFAAKYHLVTPVSGAVVLETAQQYKDAGLHPVDPSSAPTTSVPEPGSIIALATGLAGMAGLALKKRRK